MFKLLGGLSVYFKYQPIRIDNAVFRLHNIFTTVLLLTCSMIITATQYVGQPIQCIVNGLPVHVVNTFCWITSTFTMPDAFAREVSLCCFLLLICIENYEHIVLTNDGKTQANLTGAWFTLLTYNQGSP